MLGDRATALVIVGVSGRPTECSVAGRAIDLDDVARAGDYRRLILDCKSGRGGFDEEKGEE